MEAMVRGCAEQAERRAEPLPMVRDGWVLCTGALSQQNPHCHVSYLATLLASCKEKPELTKLCKLLQLLPFSCGLSSATVAGSCALEVTESIAWAHYVCGRYFRGVRIIV